MKRSQEDVGGGRDNILGDGLSLFSHCPRMIGFLFAFSSPLFFHSFLLLLCCETLLYFSCVILWLDLELCCLSQFVHFVSQEKGERENFLASNFPPRSFFYEWGWVWSSFVTFYRLDWSCDTHETLLYFRRVFFLSEFPFLFFGWCEFEKDCAAISSKAVQLESLMVKCQRVGSEI